MAGVERSQLKPGRLIRIPTLVRVKPKGKAARRAEKKGGRGRWYRVRSGDSLWKIARRFKKLCEVD